MTIAVIKFGGSNCEKDTVRALSYLGIESKIVWYKEEIPEDTDGIIMAIILEQDLWLQLLQ
jgi:phosphoribosylformylglycinamidine synthase